MQMKTTDILRNEVTASPGTSELVDIHGLIKAVWKDPATAPCTRTIARMRERRLIPFIKLGHLIYYSPPAVVAAITQRHTIQPRFTRTP
jgi:hypothetical protein